MLVLSKDLNFKQCAYLIGNLVHIPPSESADSLNKIVSRVLRRLKGNWLFHVCFSTACFRKLNLRFNDVYSKTLRPNWQTNVAVLGEVVYFNLETMELLLSFMDPDELEYHIQQIHTDTNFF